MISQGDLFWFDFGPQSSHLQEGPRPALVIQGDLMNRLDSYYNVIIVPVTTKQRQSPTYIRLEPSVDNQLSDTNWAITNQIYTIDKRRLGVPMGRISRQELFSAKEALRISLGML